MKITHLYVADCHMKWNGIDLEPGDLYGHHDFHGLVYSHVPTYGNLVYFTCVNTDEVITASIRELPNVTPWETMDGGTCFDALYEMPEEYFPVVLTTADDWDVELVKTLLDECKPDEEVALYIDGDEAYFFIMPLYSSPDRNQWGECIETWNN